jgi:hypothetical protein
MSRNIVNPVLRPKNQQSAADLQSAGSLPQLACLKEKDREPWPQPHSDDLKDRAPSFNCEVAN